jgi:hypothetical protein
MIHELKTAPVYFNRSWSGEKLFEVRRNDRHFQKGDGIILMEWNGVKYTGSQIFGSITYVLGGFDAINSEYVVFGFRISKKRVVEV